MKYNKTSGVGGRSMNKNKYKVWDKRDERMYSWEAIKDFFSFDEMERESLVWLQCTGLKDKNGTEIYEGDIVSYNSPFTDSERLMVVEWSKEDACFCFGSVRTDYASKYSEVIGNIYEEETA